MYSIYLVPALVLVRYDAAAYHGIGMASRVAP